MSKLLTVIEQTSFLLECQKEALVDCQRVFNDLLTVIQARLAKGEADSEDVQSLQKVYELIGDHSKQVLEEAQVDVDFLSEQLESLQKLKSLNDPEQVTEILSMLIDDSIAIKDTATFKREVLEEASVSKQGLVAMVTDIKDAITEGSAEEVAMYLTTIIENDEAENDDDEDECCSDDKDGCGDDACGADEKGMCACGKNEGAGCGSGCNGCGSDGKGCGSSEPLDILGQLKDYKKSMLDHADEKTQH